MSDQRGQVQNEQANQMFFLGGEDSISGALSSENCFRPSITGPRTTPKRTYSASSPTQKAFTPRKSCKNCKSLQCTLEVFGGNSLPCLKLLPKRLDTTH